MGMSDNDNASPSAPGWDNALFKMEEIRALEKRVVELKQQLMTTAAAAPTDKAGDDLTFLLMRVGGKKVAVPVQNVEEVAQMPAISPLHGNAKAIMGLVDFHGRMLAVVDLADLLGMGTNPITVDKTLVVFSLDPHKFAVMIDESADVMTVPKQSIQVSNEVLPGAVNAAGVLRLSASESVLVFDVGSIALAAELIGIIDSLEAE